jgi:hypothetical protein
VAAGEHQERLTAHIALFTKQNQEHYTKREPVLKQSNKSALNQAFKSLQS